MIVCVNGTFLDEKKATVSVLDSGLLYGDGFYDTMRTYDGVILEQDLHLERVAKSANTMGIVLPWNDKKIARWLEETVKRNTLKSARVRITVTRGNNGFDFVTSKHPTLIITCEKLVIDPKIYRDGVTAATMKMQRLMPEIKTVGLTSMIIAYRETAKTGDYEVFLVDTDGMLLEGASTNVFLVKRDVLYTPAHGMLEGLTRKRAIALGKKLGYKVIVKNIPARMLKQADEVFLTNRPREIIPVIRVDGKKIGDGKPGPVTRSIMDAYHEYIREETKGKR